MKAKNWRVIFLQLCIDANSAAEFTPTECRHSEELYTLMRDEGYEASKRYAEAAGGRCLELWNKYQEAMK